MTGVPHNFFANRSELMSSATLRLSSSSIDLGAVFSWEVAHGFSKVTDFPTQLEYGA